MQALFTETAECSGCDEHPDLSYYSTCYCKLLGLLRLHVIHSYNNNEQEDNTTAAGGAATAVAAATAAAAANGDYCDVDNNDAEVILSTVLPLPISVRKPLTTHPLVLVSSKLIVKDMVGLFLFGAFV